MASEIKSIRLEEDLAQQLHKDSNFSNIANQAIRQYLNKQVWVPNFQIEKYANISASELIRRVQKVEFLRYNSTTLKFTLYPVSEDELKWNKNIFDYANGRYNAIHDSFVYFNLHFPVHFLLFLKSKTWEQVLANIHGFLALLYWIDKSKRNIMEGQLERKTLKKIIQMVKDERFTNLDKISKNMHDDPKIRAAYSEQYFRLVIDLGIDPLLFPHMKVVLNHLHYPIHFKDALPDDSFLSIHIPAGYMRNIYDETDDWQSIVVNGTEKKDNLHRSESSAKPWKSWIEEYSFFHYRELNQKQAKRNRKA